MSVRQIGRLRPTVHCTRCGNLHAHWNRELSPALTVASGDIFTLVCPDASNGLLRESSTSADIATVDFRRLDPLCGPVFIDGAQPGDALKIEILDLELASWGWTGLLPDFGLLSDVFPEPYFRSFDLGAGAVEIFGERFPLRPMLGVLGVAPAEDGEFPSTHPTAAGGNIDVRYLTKGATLYLPVLNKGALLSGGDGHALQGEGEISGTAIEASITATLKIDVLKGCQLPRPFADISTLAFAETEYRDFLGIGPDLFTAARDAVLFAVEELARSLGIEASEAYAAMGMIGELRIHEIVDKPNWVVGCLLPKRLFSRYDK